MDEQFNKEYYESIDKEDGFSPSHESNSLYPRHPINTEVRTSLNDVYLFIYHDKPNSYGYSPSYKQSFDLEYYSGSVKVNNPIRISNSTGFDITIISQTTYLVWIIIDSRKSRLSYIPSLLERWGGFVFIHVNSFIVPYPSRFSFIRMIFPRFENWFILQIIQIVCYWLCI